VLYFTCTANDKYPFTIYKISNTINAVRSVLHCFTITNLLFTRTYVCQKIIKLIYDQNVNYENRIHVIGNRLIAESGDSKSKKFLFERIFLAIQRGNAARIRGTFPVSAIL
jgi:hypothetical protein